MDSNSSALHRDVLREISSRDLTFYQNQRAILEGKPMIPLTTTIGTKPVLLVEMLICLLFIISFIHRLVFKSITHEKRFHKFTQHFNVPDRKKKKLKLIFSNMIESAIGAVSCYTDLTIYIIIMLVTLCHVIYVYAIVEPDQSHKFNCTNDAEAYKHHTRPMQSLIPDHINNISVNEHGQITVHDNKNEHPDTYYIPKHFMSVYTTCAVMFGMALQFYIFCSINHHRLAIKELAGWTKDSKSGADVEPKLQRQIVSLLGHLLCSSKRYEFLENDDDSDEDDDKEIPKTSQGRILIEGEDYTKLLNRDSIFVYIVGENAYYGCVIMVLLRFADFIGVLVTGHMAGKTTFYPEVMLTTQLCLLLWILIAYCYFDVSKMGARGIVMPYVYFISIALGMLVEMSIFHVNRIYTDILAILILIVTILIALPIHFWKNSSEFMKRHANESPKVTSKQWEIQSPTTKKAK